MAGEIVTPRSEQHRGDFSLSSMPWATLGRRYTGRGILYIIAIFSSAVFMFPFVWTVLSSLKTGGELFLFPPTWFPAVPQPQNYLKVFDIVPWGGWTWNSVIVALLSTFGAVIFDWYLVRIKSVLDI